MTNPIISVRDLVVSYGGRRVLDGVNLDIQQGEVMALHRASASRNQYGRYRLARRPVPFRVMPIDRIKRRSGNPTITCGRTRSAHLQY